MANQSRYTLYRLLTKLPCPLLLLCGDLDPWVGPAKAARIREFYQDTTIVNLQASHCPHDEASERSTRRCSSGSPPMSPASRRSPSPQARRTGDAEKRERERGEKEEKGRKEVERKKLICGTDQTPHQQN
uniref:AB hydrolase-1 domain-containing protein n=1 Tax=Oryza brachyantha TaxID=4533 RepID=J3LW65_ORYBR